MKGKNGDAFTSPLGEKERVWSKALSTESTAKVIKARGWVRPEVNLPRDVVQLKEDVDS